MSSVQAAPAPASSHPGPRPQPASTPPPADDSAAGKENTHDSSNLPSGTSSSTKRASWNLDAPVYVPLEGSGPKPQSVGGAQSRGGPPFRPRSLGRRPGRGANRGSPFAPSQYGGPAQVPAYYAVPPVQPVYATVPGEGAYGQPASSVALVYPATQYAAYDPNAMYMAGFSSASNFEQGTVPYVFTDDYDTPVMYNQSQDIDYRTGTESDNQSIAGSIGASSDYTHADSSISYMGSIVTQASMGSGGRQSGPGGGRRIDRNHRGYAAKSNSSASTPPGSQNSSNTEERRMEQRQKQIDYGKNTAGYQRYIAMIPKQRRKRSDPETPKKETKCSKRCWDGLIRQWRRELHAWDPPEGTSEEQTGWDLPGMTQQKPRQSSSPFDPSARPMNMSEPPQPIDTRWSKPLAARNLFDDTPNLTNPGFPSWADFSLDELDQKFARKLRPNETFEGFGLSPPKRDTQYSWAQFDIEKLDEKFGHKLRISEAVEMAWG
ncbi:histone RNA hairpin-binding protein RNA-binding domain-containing protein [Fimicolochytrium jonesii]|uniref:histone RNA hairpin-binding protein RNA-binding domain-containing protein n=1 Tax=Fimicolochytrium jonesii TaxID=1396493 RepID=UPI0022FF207F|nr:histone RNA hairpin-binding protein RNA-binding domain-containing protein [Fimicolochytrium jonesii]KAI8825133.1 histone RNA hairpin-binding protein RNA-binding domain-containing protein [Fimicolochytrium jonesii]